MLSSVTLICSHHLKDLERKFSEELKRLQESQRRDYREWLTKLYEDQQNGKINQCTVYSAQVVRYIPV